jgi:phosphatidylserine/phosphatidylglycerophosphate/cardiolipin synthase-like enzyme
MKYFIQLSTLLLFLILPLTLHAQLFENMETGVKGGYAPAAVTLSTGDWFFSDALLGTAAQDRKNGTQSARIRDGYIQMNFNFPNGLSEVSFYAANSGFSGDTGGIVQVSYSTNNGTTWTPLGDPITLTSTLEQYAITASIEGNIRLRFTRTAGNRINVDDILISEYIESGDEPSLLFRVNDVPYENGSTYDLGTNTGTATRNLQLRNIGEEDLVISSFTLEGDEYSINGNMAVTLGNLENATFPLSFNSEAPGVFTGKLTLNTNDPNNETFEINFTAETLDTSQPIPIAEARALPQGTIVTVAGWMTVSSQFAGPVYFQDETGGLAWYNNELMREAWLIEAGIGDYITVTGQLGNFNNLLQIINDTGYSVDEEAFQVVEPTDITLAQLNTGAYEGQLVRITDVSFTSTGTFSGGTNYPVTDASGTGQLRVDNFSNIPGASIPNVPAEIVGVAGRFLANHQILPRFRSDISVLSGPVIVTAPPYETNATSNSITFEWETQLAGHSEVRFGTTPALELGVIVDETPRTNHSITLDNLAPATVYKVQLRSAVGQDTSRTSVYISSTGSPVGSTGEILTFFNKSVAHELATYQEAEQNVHFGDRLVELINAAEESAVFTFYNISGTVGNAVAIAIINAHNRGVDVRVIGSGHTGNPNTIITQLQNNGVRAVQSLGMEQMHNKFAIFDANHSDPSKAWVVTSSWNTTNDGTFNQFQNMVNIQDVALARAYVREFNQMWGAESGNFNASNAKFSDNKVVVNPSIFWMGEDNTKVELYFSPQANTEAQINRTLTSAQTSIDLALNLITRRSISNTMLARFNQGVKVRGAIGEVGGQGSDFEYLSGWADVHHFQTGQFGLLHHKYAIIDGEVTTDNSKVITGSHNWSANANFSNDENTLVIHNPRVANEFFQEFGARYWQAGGEDQFNVSVNIEEEDSDLPQRVTLSQNYPNPFNPTTNIRYELPSDQQVTLQVFDVTGRLVATLMNNQWVSSGTHTISFDASRLASGMYLYRLQLGNGEVLSRKMTLIK